MGVLAGRRAWWIEAATVAAAALLLQGVEIDYVANYFGQTWSTGTASLIHLQAGLLLMVAMLCGDRRVLAIGFLAIFLGWVLRLLWMDQLWAMRWTEFPLVAANTLLKFAWTAACARWIGAPFGGERPFGVRDMPKFVAFGLVLFPLGWAALVILSHLVYGHPGWVLANEGMQQFLAKHVGVACATLPLLLFWTDGQPQARPVRRFLGFWAMLGALLLVAWWVDSGALSVGPEAWLTFLYDYRLTVGAVLIAGILVLPPAWSMPLLLIVHFVQLHVLADQAQRTHDLAGVGPLLAHVLELNVMALLLVGSYLVNRERRDAYARLKRAVRRDPTTGLPNATALHDAWMRLQAPPPGVGFLAFDHIDRLVASYGWSAELALLREVSAVVEPTVQAYHLGGAQFVLLPAEGDAREGDAAWRDSLHALQKHAFAWQGASLRMTPYLGIAAPQSLSPAHLQDCIADACEAAMQARQRGETEPVHAQQSPGEGLSVADRRQRFSDAADAISRIRSGQIELHMQRIVRIDGLPEAAGLCGEVVCRLRDAAGELVLPYRFIPQLEANGHVAELDLAVVESLFTYMHANPGFCATMSRVGVNLSGASLSSDSFRNRLSELLRDCPVPYDMLCFELTETAVVSRFEPAMKLFMDLRALGCQMALDDFGSGVQNFERLRQMPVDIIKIDGQFVRHASERGSDYEIVRAAVAVAKAHGLVTVAEFVEDEATHRCLRDLGVNWGQGYLYARPVPLDEIWKAPPTASAAA